MKDDGSILFGKLLLEIFLEKLYPFNWIITKDRDELTKEKKVHVIRTSEKTLNRMFSKTFGRSRDIKLDIIYEELAPIYPSLFTKTVKTTYKSGSLAEVLNTNMLSKLSELDKEALNNFIPDYLARESAAAINIVKAKTQIKTLKGIASEITTEIAKQRTESWWQNYIKNNILIIQQGYIYAIDKLNVGIGNTKYPDFVLLTHDLFLDILEIKKPSTIMLKHDEGRDNYYWDSEITKAIIQIENYIEFIMKNADSLRGFIKDNHKIDMKIIRPRGLILAGTMNQLKSQKAKDDYRLLTLANKNISFITFDELAVRLNNYINVLELKSKK